MPLFLLDTWVNRVLSASASTPRRKRRRLRLASRAGMELLEDRTLLATVTVHVFNYNFSINPQGSAIVEASINVGDTVHWVWDQGFHSTHSVAGSIETWDSKVAGPGNTFDHTFTHSGTFAYYCAVHGSDNGDGTTSGMAGTVTVAAASLTSIAVTPANPSVPKGETQQFTATGTFSDNSTQDLTNQVTWASATTSVATITSAGLATGAGLGTSTISATMGTIVGSTTMTVSAPAVRSIAVTPANPSVPKGLTQPFTATGTFSDNSTQDVTSQVTWASATTSVATITTAGLASALKIGTSSISATLGNVSGATTLTVTAPVVRSIAVTPANPSVPKGLTEAFTATGTLSDNSTQDLTGTVTWASATTSVATISAAGVASALKIGTSTISATLSGVSGSTTLTVSAPIIQSIAVTPTNPSVPKGESEQFTATGTLSDSSTEEVTSQVTWASATTSVATISAAGLASTVTVGTSSISATLGNLSGSTVLTVSAPVVKSIAVTPSNPAIAPGTSVQFSATGTFTDNTTADSSAQVTWGSATASVATISTSGLATAVTHGTSLITATLGTIAGSTVLTVKNVTLSSIAVTPVNPSVPKGKTQQFDATGKYSDNSTQDLTSLATWATDTPTVASITAAGLASTLKVGTATISALFQGVTGSTTLTVSPAVLLSIAVTPANPMVPKGDTQQFTATGTFSDNSMQDVSTQVTWGTDTPAVATITAAGLAAALKTGTSKVSATLGALSASTVLTVTPGVLTSLAVTPTNPSVPKGETDQFTATGTYSDSSTQDLTNQVTWASATAAVATITSAGLASALTLGSSTITATLGSVNGSTTLTVSAAVVQSIAVTPANPSVPKGKNEAFTATGTFSDKSTQDLTSQVTWGSATTSVATISPAGLASTLMTGTSAISAILGSATGSTTLTVVPAVLQSIAVTPATPSVPKGEAQQFTATGTLTDNSNEDLTSQVTWASATTAVATISATGLATALTTGTSSISATLGTIAGSTVLTVAPAVVLSIAVKPANPLVPKGESEPFTATGTLSDSSTQDLTSQVTWASASTTVATISAAGLASTLATGGSSISATLGSVTGSTLLTVSAPVLQSIAVTPANPTVPKGESRQLIATGTLTDSTTQDLSAQVTWASATPAVASVSATGLVHALLPGSSSISATLGNISGATVLTVVPAALVSIAVTPAAPSVAAGLNVQFTATGAFSDNTSRDLTGQVTWASATRSVATISSSGLASTLTPGGSSISATLGTIAGSTLLTVTNVSLQSIAVTPANPNVPKGETEQFTATGTFSDTSTQDLTGQVMWAVDTAAVASISASGLATTLTTGMTMVMAMVGNTMGFTMLTVTPAVLQSIAVKPTSTTLPKGETQQLTATGSFSDNSMQDLTNQVTWSSATPSVGSVSSTGLVRALSVGTSFLSATLGSIAGSAALTVTPAVLLSIAVTPASPSVAKGQTQQLTATGTFSDNTSKDLAGQVTWASANTSVASVSSTGLVTATGTGAASLTATLGGTTGSTSLTVTPAVLLAIAVSANASSLTAGTAESFRATGTFSDNSTEDLTGQVTWGSANAAVATISGSGVASGGAAGATTITATLRGVSGSAALTVTPIPIPPNPQFVASGMSVRARAHRKFNGTIARFSEPHTKAHDFQASIAWGDHTVATSGQIRARGRTGFTITGNHSYSQQGTFHVTVTIRDSAGRVVTTMSQVRVAK